MSEDPEDRRSALPEEEPVEGGLSDEEAPALRALLKRSLAAEQPRRDEAGATGGPTEADRALLLGVQKKLRQRSKGKFYADGWSTAQSRVSYALVAVIMLVTIVVVYLALGPTGIR